MSSPKSKENTKCVKDEEVEKTVPKYDYELVYGDFMCKCVEWIIANTLPTHFRDIDDRDLHEAISDTLFENSNYEDPSPTRPRFSTINSLHDKFGVQLKYLPVINSMFDGMPDD